MTLPWHDLQRRVMRSLRRKLRQRSPSSSSSSGLSCAAASATGGLSCAGASASGASELREKGLGGLHRAAARGDVAWLRHWRCHVKSDGIDRRGQEGRTPLRLSSANGHADVVRYVVRKNSQPNLADNFKRTPLIKEEYTLANLAASKIEETLECPQRKAADKDDQAHCESIAVVTAILDAYLEEDNLRLQKELDKVEAELQEEEEKCLESEPCVRDLETALVKEREVITQARELQGQLLAHLETNTTAKQLEEQVHCLEIKNARLEATVRQNNEKFEALRRDLQASALVDEPSQQLHKECKNCMQLKAKNEDLQEDLSTLHAKCEKLEKTKCQLKEEVAKLQHDLETNMEGCRQKEQYKREVEEQANQERRQQQQEVHLFLHAQAASQDRLEQLRSSDHESLRNELQDRIRDLERELARIKNTQLDSPFQQESIQAEVETYKQLYLEEVKLRKCKEKNLEKLEQLLTTDRRQPRLDGEKETESQWEEMKNKYSEKVCEVDRLRTEVSELSQQLDIKSKQCMQLEAQIQDLQEKLSALHGKCENLEKSKCHLKEEVDTLQRRLKTNMVDHSQTEEYKREVEERADQEIRQILHIVNLLLQAQAASQDRLEQLRSNDHESLRNELQDRIRDLERELARIKNTQLDSPFQKQSMEAEVQKYKELYLEEAKLRKCLAKKLERANKRLAEVNAKLLQECSRSKSSVANSIVSRHLAASPILDSSGRGHLARSLGLDRNLSLGRSFIGAVKNASSSGVSIEAYVSKVRQELDENITRQLQQATAELESGFAGSSKKH